jgi:hypothetical protein
MGRPDLGTLRVTADQRIGVARLHVPASLP